MLREGCLGLVSHAPPLGRLPCSLLRQLRRPHFSTSARSFLRSAELGLGWTESKRNVDRDWESRLGFLLGPGLNASDPRAPGDDGRRDCRYPLRLGRERSRAAHDLGKHHDGSRASCTGNRTSTALIPHCHAATCRSLPSLDDFCRLACLVLRVGGPVSVPVPTQR